MLTVKHIMPSGCESIYSAIEVRYDPGMGEGSIADKPTLWIDVARGDRIDTQGLGSQGSFYVMNDAGRTVAKYLMEWPGPSMNVPPAPISATA